MSAALAVLSAVAYASLVGRYHPGPPTVTAAATRASISFAPLTSKASSRRAGGVLLSEETPSAEDNEEGEASMLASFERRGLETGVGTSVRELQMQELRKGATKKVTDAAIGFNKVLDEPGEPGGIMETGGWRLTVGFGLLTILLAFYAAQTTDFGDRLGGDASRCTGDVALCTRAEIDNSRIAEIAARNRLKE